MRIVYDKTQTREKGLAGWSDPQPDFSSSAELSAADLALWQRLGPAHDPTICRIPVTHPSLRFWDQLFLVGKADQSQYDILRENSLASQQRIACIALSGNGFHGQRDRLWSALEGNLHLSICMPLDLPTGSESLVWTMLPAVAVMRTLEILGIGANDNCGIKWINDVLLGKEKLAGAISSLVVSGDKVSQGFLGIGLNIAHAPSLSVPTCCLHQHLTPGKIPLGLVLQVVLACVADLVLILENGQNEDIINDYQKFSLAVGRQVRIMTDPIDGNAEEICRGRVQKIQSDLGLVFEHQDESLHQGRLFFLD